MSEEEERRILDELLDRKVSPYPKLLMGLADDDRDARLMPATFNLMSLASEYYEAAVTLLDEAPRPPDVDGVIMPILLLYRHFVELALKEIILALGAHLHLRAGEMYRLWGHHKLTPLLQEVRAMHARAKPFLDEQGTVLLPSDQAQRFIEELAAVDPEGMGFRYPYQKTEAMLPVARLQPILKDTVWVNLDVLKAGMLHVHKELTWYANMVRISTNLYSEYLADLGAEDGQ